MDLLSIFFWYFVHFLFIYRFTGSSTSLLLWWLQHKDCKSNWSEFDNVQVTQGLTSKALGLSGLSRTRMTTLISRRAVDALFIALERFTLPQLIFFFFFLRFASFPRSYIFSFKTLPVLSKSKNHLCLLCTSTMSWMKSGKGSVQRMLQSAGLNSYAPSLVF